MEEKIKDMPLLVYGSPEIVAYAMHGEKHLIQMPRVSRSGTSVAQLMGIGLPELPAPRAHGFIGQDDPTRGHQCFNVPVAQAKTEVQPEAVTDDLRRKPKTFIGAKVFSPTV